MFPYRKLQLKCRETKRLPKSPWKTTGERQSFFPFLNHILLWCRNISSSRTGSLFESRRNTHFSVCACYVSHLSPLFCCQFSLHSLSSLPSVTRKESCFHTWWLATFPINITWHHRHSVEHNKLLGGRGSTLTILPYLFYLYLLCSSFLNVSLRGKKTQQGLSITFTPFRQYTAADTLWLWLKVVKTILNIVCDNEMWIATLWEKFSISVLSNVLISEIIELLVFGWLLFVS